MKAVFTMTGVAMLSIPVIATSVESFFRTEEEID
jgi:hypothetical protein